MRLIDDVARAGVVFVADDNRVSGEISDVEEEGGML